VLTGGILILGLFGFNIKVDNDFVGLFRPSSTVRQHSQKLHEELSGVQTFAIHISSGTSDAFKQPENLAQVAEIQTFLRKTGWCDTTNSIADYLLITNREMHDGDEKFYRLPESSDLVAQYFLIMPTDELESLITDDYSEVKIVVRHNVSSSHELKDVVAQVDSFVAERLNPYFDYHITGETILTMTAADTLATGQVISLSFTLLVIFILMSPSSRLGSP